MAGDDAWLGKEAPEDPALDVSEDESLLMLPPATGASAEAPQKDATARTPDPDNHLSFGERLHALQGWRPIFAMERPTKQAIATVREGEPRSWDRQPVSCELTCISMDALHSGAPLATPMAA